VNILSENSKFNVTKKFQVLAFEKPNKESEEFVAWITLRSNGDILPTPIFQTKTHRRKQLPKAVFKVMLDEKFISPSELLEWIIGEGYITSIQATAIAALFSKEKYLEKKEE